ncbi:protein FAM170B-like [Monodelphis domestica]|uniref:Protein FAM170B-like n=1 Tax=Monodelphis domestica TaxID=13616 RepID=K7E1V1_MONDO|nr:protein FAM170B-like [Monodelphis domestica]XP_007479959.1 protein FAM170B-like [Monodelphis domestica]XP_007479960.1 protein FAM170B-like [Monodelphis domestica]XP_007479961.1 protein FAM170B-like [Monodelphis domestica]XP_016284135.1 protein FAM170B-like [Monodelphis domestica]XP_056666131.1 protein FAM170B-like [Monodelphis domestica]XP_056666133.1 protein FAM170B-like [Monodelphis domestica]XP_056666134.1 protein FAM170B-like [Monodelphis domestica]
MKHHSEHPKKQLQEKRASAETSEATDKAPNSPKPGPSAPKDLALTPIFNDKEVEKREDSSSSSPYFVYEKPHNTTTRKIDSDDTCYSCAYYARVRTVKGVAIKWHTSDGFRAIGKKPQMYEAEVSGETTIGSPPTSSVTTMRQDVETSPSEEDPCEIKMKEIDFQSSQNTEDNSYEDPSEDETAGPSHKEDEERPRVATPDWLVTTDKGFRCLACCRVFLTLEALMEHARYGVKEGFSCRVFNEAMLEMRCNQEKKREHRWRQAEIRRHQIETWKQNVHNWRHRLDSGHHQDPQFNQAQVRHHHLETWHRQAQARRQRIQTHFNQLRVQHQQESQCHQESQFNQLRAQYRQQESQHYQVQNRYHRPEALHHRPENQIQEGLNRCHQLEIWNNQAQAWRRRLEIVRRHRETQLQQAEVRHRRLENWCHQARARRLRLEAQRHQREARHIIEAQHHHRESQINNTQIRYHQLESIHHLRETRFYPGGVWNQVEIRHSPQLQAQLHRTETMNDQQEAQLHQAAEEQHRARETHRHQARAQHRRSMARHHQARVQRR